MVLVAGELDGTLFVSVEIVVNRLSVVSNSDEAEDSRVGLVDSSVSVTIFGAVEGAIVEEGFNVTGVDTLFARESIILSCRSALP